LLERLELQARKETLEIQALWDRRDCQAQQDPPDRLALLVQLAALDQAALLEHLEARDHKDLQDLQEHLVLPDLPDLPEALETLVHQVLKGHKEPMVQQVELAQLDLKGHKDLRVQRGRPVTQVWLGKSEFQEIPEMQELLVHLELLEVPGLLDLLVHQV